MIIYKTTNIINNKIYIGKACGKNVANNYLGSGKWLKRALAKHGRDNFKRVIIDIAVSKKELCLKEIFWISFYDARNPSVGYNIAQGGSGGIISDEHKEKLRNANMGKSRSEEIKRKISESHMGKSKPWLKGKSTWNKGKELSNEIKQKMSCAHIGKKLTEEHKQKMRDSQKKRYANGAVAWNKGRCFAAHI